LAGKKKNFGALSVGFAYRNAPNPYFFVEEFMDTQNNMLTIREYPLGEWGFGLLMLLVAGFTAVGASGDWSITLIAGVAGVLFILLGTILVVQADRVNGMLTIRRTALLRKRYVREIPITDIAALQLEASQGSSTYRIVVVTKENETIPFRTVYSSGKATKEARAKKLRDFLGVGGADMSAGGMFHLASSLAQQVFQEKQEVLTGPEAEEHVTEGVHWKTQTLAFGGTVVTRWFSPDQQCPGGFVFVAQKVVGQPAVAGGLLGGMNKLLYHELIGIYGFGGEETPGLDSAMLLAAFDPQLDPHFSVFTSDPQAAQQTLAWSVAALVDWATRYPLKQMQPTRQLFGQLVVMICPGGTYVASMGNMIPEAVQELTNLGVALVKGK
jgi:hypothetical protein